MMKQMRLFWLLCDCLFHANTAGPVVKAGTCVVSTQSGCIQGMNFLRRKSKNQDLLLTSEKRGLDQTYQLIQWQKPLKI